MGANSSGENICMGRCERPISPNNDYLGGFCEFRIISKSRKRKLSIDKCVMSAGSVGIRANARNIRGKGIGRAGMLICGEKVQGVPDGSIAAVWKRR